jgi:hypothetical protein
MREERKEKEVAVFYIQFLSQTKRKGCVKLFSKRFCDFKQNFVFILLPDTLLAL